MEPSSEKPQDKNLAGLENLAKLLDNQFAIPGTNFRFGLDGIIGLIPYIGDVAGFIVAGFLMRTMSRKGAGPILMLRVMGNYILDTVVGVVPILGDLFDFGFKANRRNVELLKKYYASGDIKPDAARSVGWIGLMLLVVFLLALYTVWKIAAWILGAAIDGFSHLLG